MDKVIIVDINPVAVSCGDDAECEFAAIIKWEPDKHRIFFQKNCTLMAFNSQTEHEVTIKKIYLVNT